MATSDRKVRILTPSLQSMNKLLLELVEYQARKSSLRFWDDMVRANRSPDDFDHEWFTAWKHQEVNKFNLEYVYSMFKRFVRSTVSTEGMAVTRTFPRLEIQDGVASFIPLEVSYSEWADPALAFRDMAQFTDPEVTGIWDGIDFTTTDLILQVCQNFNEFLPWFRSAVDMALDKIRDAALLMSKLQSRFQWVEKLDFKVILLIIGI